MVFFFIFILSFSISLRLVNKEIMKKDVGLFGMTHNIIYICKRKTYLLYV